MAMLLERMGIRVGTQVKTEPQIQSYNSEVMAALQPLMVEAFRQMKKNADPRVYDLVIGDDFSGRIPAYVAVNVLRKVAGGPQPLGMLFDPDPNDSGVADRFSQRLEAAGVGSVKRALFVTEYISSGRTVRSIGEALKSKGIPFDVLSVSSPSEKILYQYGDLLGDCRLFSPGRNINFVFSPGLIHNYDLIGLPKKFKTWGQETSLSQDEAIVQAKRTKQDIVNLSEVIARDVFMLKT